MDECANNQYATARCRPEAEADNRVVAESEDGYFSGTTGLPVGLHLDSLPDTYPFPDRTSISPYGPRTGKNLPKIIRTEPTAIL
ncbi:MAG: hypothetical protein JRJ17_01385 [Deltaproteobacteria bacterium]|nr:hypothetical protein [Deltaproteobacteria bacterium]